MTAPPMILSTLRVCKKCDTQKSLALFAKYVSKRKFGKPVGGYSHTCMACKSARDAERARLQRRIISPSVEVQVLRGRLFLSIYYRNGSDFEAALRVVNAVYPTKQEG